MELRTKYLEEMAQIHRELFRMGALVESALKKGLSAVKNYDQKLAQTVIEDDLEIDALQVRIEDMATILIATEQPVASDLREIIMIIKVVSDLERIGDHARHLAKSTLNIPEFILNLCLTHIESMTNLGIQMVHDALHALANRDESIARKILEEDKLLDKMSKEFHIFIIEILKKNQDHMETATGLIFINRFLERLGDHVANICDWIIYARKGNHG